MPSIVLVTGDRHWTDRRYLIDVLDTIHAHDPIGSLIEGDAPGADWMAGAHPPESLPHPKSDPALYADPGWAWARRVPGRHFPADWDRFHKAAGPIRNAQMLKEGQPDLVVAFHPDLSQSRGTRDMVQRAERAGVPVLVSDGRSLLPVVSKAGLLR